MPKKVPIGKIYVQQGRRECVEATVVDLVDSMRHLGQRTPITVRRARLKSGRRRIVLVAGLHRLRAAQRLGWKSIIADTISRAEAEAWEIAENLHRAELSVLERSCAWARWLESTVKGKKSGSRTAAVKDAPGLQGKSLSAKRQLLQRSKVIAGISEEAKDAAVRAGLQNRTRALLAIAKERSPKAQVEAVERLSVQKDTPGVSGSQHEPEGLTELWEQWQRAKSLRVLWLQASPPTRIAFLQKIRRDRNKMRTRPTRSSQ